MNNKNTKLQAPLSLRMKKRIDFVLKKKKIVISVFLIGIVLAAIISFLLPKLYRTNSSAYFKYNTVNSTYLSQNGNLDNEIKLLNSDEFLKNIVTNLAKKRIPISVNDIIENLELFANEAGTNIDFKFVNNDPDNSAEILNTITEDFAEKSLLKSRASYLSALKVIDEREKLLVQDIKRGMANQTTSISALSFEHDRIINQISEFESELESIVLENSFYNSQLSALQKILEEKYPDFSTNIEAFNNDKLAEVKQKLEKLEAQSRLSLISQKLGNFKIDFPWEEQYNLNDTPTTKSRGKRYLSSHIEDLTKNSNIANIGYLNELSREIFYNQIKVNAIDITTSIIFNTLTLLEDQFNQIPFGIIDDARSARIKKFNTKLGLKIKTAKQELRKRENEFLAEVESIQKAQVPQTYFSPNTTFNIFLGAFIGLIIGIIIAAGSSDTSKIEVVTNSTDLEESGFKIISQIPKFPDGSPLLFDSTNKNENKKLDETILSSFERIEKFIKYGDLEKALKTILVTSGEDGEGKSIVASNIAIAIANAGNKVLLVDADLMKPQLNKYFKIKATPSLAHYLFRKKELDEIIRKTYNENLDLITCIEFPQNPSVIITSERMKNFMTLVQDQYDYIVYDSSSLKALKETAGMANSIDQVILTVRANKTKLSEIITAQMVLEKYGVAEFNVVLNDIKV